LLWLTWNTLSPASSRFDPFPAFVFLALYFKYGANILNALIMVGQNLQSKHAEIRAENDFEVNLKAEKEIKEIKQELTEIKALLRKVAPNK